MESEEITDAPDGASSDILPGNSSSSSSTVSPSVAVRGSEEARVERDDKVECEVCESKDESGFMVKKIPEEPTEQEVMEHCARALRHLGRGFLIVLQEQVSLRRGEEIPERPRYLHCMSII